MSNSKLVTYTRISQFKNSPRKYDVTRITPHCVVGQGSAKTVLDGFCKPTRRASCNYAIGKDGEIGLGVYERDRSWCSSSQDNDNRAITIECASDNFHPYAMNDKVYTSLVNLCVDICKRHGKSKLLWLGNKTAALEYEPADDEMILTVHRWFAAKSCPGDWLYERLGKLAKEVTDKLGDTETEEVSELPYRVRVDVPDLAIRKGAGANYTKTGKYTGAGVYTIVDERAGTGSAKGWGKLKSGSGWISLDYTTKF